MIYSIGDFISRVTKERRRIFAKSYVVLKPIKCYETFISETSTTVPYLESEILNMATGTTFFHLVDVNKSSEMMHKEPELLVTTKGILLIWNDSIVSRASPL